MPTYNQELCDKVRKGELAIENTDRQLTVQICEYIKPDSHIYGTAKYYWVNNISNYIRNSDTKPALPYLPVSAFIESNPEDGWIRFDEQDEKTFPPVGCLYNVVWDLEDGQEPTSFSFEWDDINKRWFDVYVPEAKQIVLYWQPIPSPPKNQ